jgi:hypothetical protein
MRTPRGREVTEKAYKHLGKSMPSNQKGLFWAAQHTMLL